MLPVLIAQLVVLLKDSSLGFIVGYFELLRQARSLVEFFNSRFGDLYTFQLYVAAASSTSSSTCCCRRWRGTSRSRTRGNAKAAATAEVELPADVQMGGGGGAAPPGLIRPGAARTARGRPSASPTAGIERGAAESRRRSGSPAGPDARR